MKIGIAGAGLLGRLLAWQLAAEHEVTVHDPAPDAQARGAAGWTAAGMLSPGAELENADAALAQRGRRSLELWPRIVGALPQPVDLQRDGCVLLAHGPDLGAARRTLERLQRQGAAPQPLDAAALRALEPAVHGPAHAWLLPGEGRIHTVQAMQALAAGASARGAHWRWGRPAERVAPRAIDGTSYDHVFDVRGTGARPDLLVRGVRGEIVWVHAPGVVLNRALRLLHPRWRVYLVPRPGDLVVVGATEVESEDRSSISVRSLLGLLGAAESVLPELAEGRVVHSETNLRPALADNLPRVFTQPGLTRINGLHRHGWTLAPALVEEALEAAWR